MSNRAQRRKTGREMNGEQKPQVVEISQELPPPEIQVGRAMRQDGSVLSIVLSMTVHMAPENAEKIAEAILEQVRFSRNALTVPPGLVVPGVNG